MEKKIFWLNSLVRKFQRCATKSLMMLFRWNLNYECLARSSLRIQSVVAKTRYNFFLWWRENFSECKTLVAKFQMCFKKIWNSVFAQTLIMSDWHYQITAFKVLWKFMMGILCYDGIKFMILLLWICLFYYKIGFSKKMKFTEP